MKDVQKPELICDREPIHLPGSIQPHGVMLVVDLPTLAVRYAAGDVEALLGVANWQGLPLADIIGPVLAGRVRDLQEARGLTSFLGQCEAANGAPLDIGASFNGGFALIEFEPAGVEAPGTAVLDRIQAAIGGFEQAASLRSLCERGAEAVRRLTGFDRVMIYQFLDDDAGKVVGEARREDLHSFLNHHFPASDIPRQARALYLRNLTRTIPDIAYVPAPLRPAWAEPEPLDMSDSVLRSVSPVHLQYLANMGIRASASISIVKDGALWGLIACHHETPRALTFEMRIAGRTLAAAFAQQVKAREEADGYRERIRLRSAEDELVRLLSRDGLLDEVLANHLTEVRRALGADGIAIIRGQELIAGGIHPDEPSIRALAQWLLKRQGETVFATANLQAHYPPGLMFRNDASGVLATVLSAEEPWLLIWFRTEHIETIRWAGNPHKAPTGPGEMLTPRASFDAWAETVRGRSRRWSLPEIEAAGRLRIALLDVRHNRQLRDLNRQLTQILHDKETLLQQKDFLIGEVNHRVQNSLQLVSGFLSLQARAAEDEALRGALDEARRRVGAVALVHKRLYRGDQIQLVDLGRYVEELCFDTITSMGGDWGAHLTLDVSPVMVPTDRAVTLALVLTELLININKYAYGGRPGPIEIRLLEERSNLQLRVTDQGRGRANAQSGFGSRMMEGLVKQLGGTLFYQDNHPGLSALLTAPIEAPSGGAA